MGAANTKVVAYQDSWLKGRAVGHGERECSSRYAVIKRFCRQYRRPFTVLDIGANLGYFSLRLAEDFDCTVVAVEPQPRIGELLEANDNPRVLWLHRVLTLADLSLLGDVEHFDVVLALSVVHRMGPPPAELVAAMRRLGDHLIVEFPVEKEAARQEVVASLKIPKGGEIIGHGASHLNSHDLRPIVLYRHPKNRLGRRYIGDGRSRPASVRIDSTFDSKTAHFSDRDESRDWLRGINLHTFLSLGGEYPSPEYLGSMIREEWGRRGSHGDVRVWNMVLQGDRVAFIDTQDPTSREGYDDSAALDELVESVVKGGPYMRILNIGAGHLPIEGAVNHDLVVRKGVDVTHDLNNLPWPWPDNSFDHIVARAVFEHLSITLAQSMDECWRMLRPNGTIDIKLAYWKHERSYEDPTHRWFFGIGVFDFFDPRTKRYGETNFYSQKPWSIEWKGFTNNGQSSIGAKMRVVK